MLKVVYPQKMIAVGHKFKVIRCSIDDTLAQKVKRIKVNGGKQ